MAKSKLLIAPELLRKLLALPKEVRITGAGIVAASQSVTLYLQIEGSHVPDSEQCTAWYKNSKRNLVGTFDGFKPAILG